MVLHARALYVVLEGRPQLLQLPCSFWVEIISFPSVMACECSYMLETSVGRRHSVHRAESHTARCRHCARLEMMGGSLYVPSSCFFQREQVARTQLCAVAVERW